MNKKIISTFSKNSSMLKTKSFTDSNKNTDIDHIWGRFFPLIIFKTRFNFRTKLVFKVKKYFSKSYITNNCVNWLQ